MTDATILLAGATGDLGGRIARALRERGADVKAIVRPGAAAERIARLKQGGVAVVEVDFANRPAMIAACAGGACVVSALSGLRDVIVDTQRKLLDAAVAAGVPRFIPSDYSLDFTRLPAGTNRNFDWRREFHESLDKADIRATSVFNGAFMELLNGKAPLILFKLKRVVYWEDPDQPMDFTTMDDTAAFTAAVALDPTSPRALHIAGDQLSARDLVSVASEVTGTKFRLLRAGRLKRLERLITITRALFPAKDDVFPPWQGMQYMRDMFSGRAKVAPLDNDRYPGMRWTPARELLSRR
jgi:nucleoside-diphosphate-sugar epimerase